MLDRDMRQSWAARVSAAGFILIVLFGNLWFTYMILGAFVPVWLRGAFVFGIGGVIVGGLGLLVLSIVRRLSGVQRALDEDCYVKDSGQEPAIQDT